jgi:hypothetical protein
MMRTYRKLSAAAPQLQREAGALTLFEARVFADLYFAAKAIAETE